MDTPFRKYIRWFGKEKFAYFDDYSTKVKANNVANRLRSVNKAKVRVTKAKRAYVVWWIKGKPGSDERKRSWKR
jgi:hypothetical protein